MGDQLVSEDTAYRREQIEPAVSAAALDVYFRPYSL